jgi:hypothetical protein
LCINVTVVHLHHIVTHIHFLLLQLDFLLEEPARFLLLLCLLLLLHNNLFLFQIGINLRITTHLRVFLKFSIMIYQLHPLKETLQIVLIVILLNKIRWRNCSCLLVGRLRIYWGRGEGSEERWSTTVSAQVERWLMIAAVLHD